MTNYLEKLEGLKKKPNKHEQCHTDGSYCVDHKELMSEEDWPNGAYYYNQALEDVKDQLKETFLAGVEWAMEECIELSDKIELSEPDGGTKQWIAFKHFRNTMRYKLKELNNTGK